MRRLSLFLMILGFAAAGWAVPYRYRPAPSVPPPQTDADSAHAWDALHYELQLTVTPVAAPDSLQIVGQVRVDLVPQVAGLDTVDLHFVGLNVTAVDLGGVSCSWTRVDCLLCVALPSPHNPGDTLHLNVAYHGSPLRSGDLLGGVGLFHPWAGMIYTQADPRGLRNWMPCWDEPWDKATLRQILRFPSNFEVAANGRLESVVSQGDYRQWSYAMDHPLATYLASFCASQYATFTQTAGPVALKHFVYPQHLAAAQADLARVPEMIQTFGQYFGAYPFATFGYAEAPVFGSGGGAMENQTMVTLGHLMITGTGAYEDIIAHELAHQWFGDAAGYLDWPEMWLSEGFATYAEALWHEHLYGPAGYRQVMAGFQVAYMSWQSPANPQPMYDPPWAIIWSPLTYEKGACVLHMLRYHLGETGFFQTLQDYFAAYCHGNASTQDLAAVAQQVSGQDYGWFFDQWVFQAGYPSFEYFAVPDPQGIRLTVGQTQSANYPRFRTEADLCVYSGGDTSLVRVTLEALPTQEILVPLASACDSVRLDPLNWILGPKVRRDDLNAPLLAVVDPGFADAGGDGFLDPGESGGLYFTLSNAGLPTDSLQLILTSFDPDLTVGDSLRMISPLAYQGSYALTPDPFPVTNAPGTPPRWADLRLRVNHGSGQPLDTLYFSLPVGTPYLLLVDDDGGSEAEVKHRQALDNLRHVYRTVEYASPAALPPLAGYAAVLWACGGELSNTVTAADQALLQAYLEGGGSLFLSGRGVVPDLSAGAFFQETLHARSQGTTAMLMLYGQEPLLPGTAFFLAGSGATQDMLDPDDAPGAARLLQYLGSLGGGVTFDGAYRSCVLGFGFEDILGGNPSFNDPEELLSPLLDWLLGAASAPPCAPVASPAVFRLHPPHPNPFNPQSALSYQLAAYSHVRLKIYDTAGREVKTLVDGWREAGIHKVTFDGARLASGVYLVRLEVTKAALGPGDFTATQKLILLK